MKYFLSFIISLGLLFGTCHNYMSVAHAQGSFDVPKSFSTHNDSGQTIVNIQSPSSAGKSCNCYFNLKNSSTTKIVNTKKPKLKDKKFSKKIVNFDVITTKITNNGNLQSHLDDPPSNYLQEPLILNLQTVKQNK